MNWSRFFKTNNMKPLLFFAGVATGCLAIEGYWFATIFFIVLLVLGMIWYSLKEIHDDDFNKSW
jgi:preprotein translocase subunit SecG